MRGRSHNQERQPDIVGDERLPRDPSSIDDK